MQLCLCACVERAIGTDGTCPIKAPYDRRVRATHSSFGSRVAGRGGGSFQIHIVVSLALCDCLRDVNRSRGQAPACRDSAPCFYRSASVPEPYSTMHFVASNTK